MPARASPAPLPLELDPPTTPAPAKPTARAEIIERIGEPQADPGLVAAALAVIPNNTDWDGWNNIGMAVWRATAGSAEGKASFLMWSQKWPEYIASTEAEKARLDRITAERWEGYSKCPPTKIGAGTIFYLAGQAAPGWRQDYEARNGTTGKGVLPFHRHGERPPLDDRSWAIDTLIPEVGTGLISGQWGTLKTFLALELARCVMTARPFLDFDITRPGGVLLIALEGQNEVAIRIQGALEKGTEHHKDAPFYWCDECPPLTDPKTADVIIATAKAAAAEFNRRFDLPLSLILIDSLIAGAGYRKEGQDNDAVLTNTIMANMAKVSRALGCFVFVIDHFGKDTNVGTRGSSVKEGDAGVIFACLGDRTEGGQVSNSRLALRKRRSGPNGEEFPFRGQVVDMGLNPKTGKMETTLVIEWINARQPAFKKDDWGRGKAVKLLRRIIMNLLVDCGEQIRPFADGPLVRALKISLVETEFHKAWFTSGETEQAKRNAKRKAFQRAVDAARDGGKIVTREISGTDYIWLSQAGPGETMQGAEPTKDA